ncbi:ubiquinone biosynthesis protein [Salmonella enterica subsp. enterica serovar Sanjuan]|uniref:Ubiquinone biosynthesis protein n=1 Tax=Salmonella enterica subsp. enterica serovar Sanjuan TaxID=1160765 RepID=A0A447P300_SALET|nr:ubiquinone biosynthesis protein [Salmonella enterica subsp. enterica serovar Panama]VEA09919.1 ubiquinone biosynthesis protein [Salmonella enterica subsp. enterica serovar Sanjuan]
MTPGEVRRLYFIIRTFLSYGLDELIPECVLHCHSDYGAIRCSGCQTGIKINCWVND